MTRRWRLFPKYALLIVMAVGGMLVVSGGIGVYFSWRENQAHLVALQREKAQSAATRIEQYIGDIEHQLGWTACRRPASEAMRSRSAVRVPQTAGRCRRSPRWHGSIQRPRAAQISRLAMDDPAPNRFSQDPKFLEAGPAGTWYRAVYFAKKANYMTIARPAGSGGGVTAAEVNLKTVWEVVVAVEIGEAAACVVGTRWGR